MNFEIFRFQLIINEIVDLYEECKIFCWYLIAINVVTFSAYAIDKAKAVMGGRRISEKMLLRLSLIGGAAGGLLAMFMFRHKIRKERFTVWVPLMLCGHLAIFAFLLYKF